MINGPSRRALLAGTFAGLALPGAVSTALPAQAEATVRRGSLPRRPNILLILADDLGWAEIGSNGQRLIRTPNLDRLAAEGVQFKTAYAGAPLCAPSRCSLLTGLHAGHSTVRENPEGGPQHSLTDADLTFAEVLQLSGYRTACIGKWGFGPEEAGQASHPNMRGFDEFFGYIGHKHAHQYFPKYLWHNGQKVQLDGSKYAPHLFRQRAVEFIGAGGDQPFLLYFASTLPHSPSVVPGDAGEYEDKPWSGPNRRHAAQVARLDTDVAALIRALRDEGVAKDTLVLFTSDNGPHRERGVTPWLFDSNGPLRADKRDVYEGGIRVPLIAWSPGLSPRVERRPVASWDLLPTLADLAETPVPANLDGLSFRGLLTGEDAPRHTHLVWNRPRKAQAIRRGRWKLVRFAPNIAGAGPEGRIELYDLTKDQGRAATSPPPGRRSPRSWWSCSTARSGRTRACRTACVPSSPAGRSWSPCTTAPPCPGPRSSWASTANAGRGRTPSPAWTPGWPSRSASPRRPPGGSRRGPASGRAAARTSSAGSTSAGRRRSR
ncbi:sulfatase-like hydrolase/transferase [Nonomuraea rubra]|uniref:arylsulfatase n=1 Tax=Nonomuraea rubra TaxID=46180 RepID=UPI00360694B2